MARSAAAAGSEVVIISGDKDLAQLVDGRVLLASPAREAEPLDPAGVKEKFGVPPELVGDFLALTGDQSDNIPGVPGVGPKTARRLLEKYRDLEGVLERAPGEEAGKLASALADNAAQVRLARELIRLDDRAPLDVSPAEMVRRDPDIPGLAALYRELEFHSLLKSLAVRGTEDFPVREVAVAGDLRELAGKISAASQFAFLGCAEGESVLALEATGLALSVAGEIFLLRLEDPDILRRFRETLGPLFADPALRKTTHNCKFAFHLLARAGCELSGVECDTLLAAYLANPSRGDYSLDTLALTELGLKLREKKEPVTPLSLPRRLRAVLALEEICLPLLRERSQLELLVGLEIPVSRVLAMMEKEGVRLDPGLLERMSRGMEGKLAELSARMHEIAGEPFNLNSPVQLRHILYDKLKLKPGKKTKTGYSTDVAVLGKLASQHEFPALILEYRSYFKLKSTYIDALPGLLAPDGKIHTTFHQAVTATGRLSSSDPNLQNIPVRTEAGRKIREAFIPSREGWEFLAADYSQIELRLLAHLSGDEKMIAAFREGRDIHDFTASLIFNIPLAEVAPEMRRRAKTVNFGIIYGMGSVKLSRELGISRDEAAAFIEAYFQRYPGVKSYYEKVIARAREDGYVSTIFQRRRYLPELASSRPEEKSFGERAAMNTPIQGSAADIIKKAMVELAGRLRSGNWEGKLLLQIHDELLLETPPAQMEALSRVVRECMEGVVRLRVPVVADFKRGKNWGEMGAWAPDEA